MKALIAQVLPSFSKYFFSLSDFRNDKPYTKIGELKQPMTEHLCLSIVLFRFKRVKSRNFHIFFRVSQCPNHAVF